jgi:uncharacterized membrane protein YoaK (UPF0700 family)
MSTTNPEIAEQLRVEQIRADIARTTQEMLYEPRKYRIQFFGAVVSAFVAGGIISGVLVAYVNAHQMTPQPIVIQLQAPK